MEMIKLLERVRGRLLQPGEPGFSPPAASPYPPPLSKERRQLVRYRLLQWRQHVQQQLVRPWPPRILPWPECPPVQQAAGGASTDQQQQHHLNQHQRQQYLKLQQQQQVPQSPGVKENIGVTHTEVAEEGLLRGRRAPAAAAVHASVQAEAGKAAGAPAAAAALSGVTDAEEQRFSSSSSRRVVGRRKGHLFSLGNENVTPTCRSSSSSRSDSSSNRADSSSGGNRASMWRRRWAGRYGGEKGGVCGSLGNVDKATQASVGSDSNTGQRPKLWMDTYSFVPLEWKAPSLWPARFPLPPAPPPPAAVGSRGAAVASLHAAAGCSSFHLLRADPHNLRPQSSPSSSFAGHANASAGAAAAPPAAAATAAAGSTAASSGLRVHPVGHGTFLLQCRGMNILTDPILSTHAGPWGCLGLPRVSQAAASLDSLPHIDAILISSVRYDAYDHRTVYELCKRDGCILFVPEGACSLNYFSPLTFDSIYPMKWGDRVRVDNLTVCFTPAIHARVDRYLWGSAAPARGGFILQWTAHAAPRRAHREVASAESSSKTFGTHTHECTSSRRLLSADPQARSTQVGGSLRESVQHRAHAKRQQQQQQPQQQQQQHQQREHEHSQQQHQAPSEQRQQRSTQSAQQQQQQLGEEEQLYGIDQKTVYYAGRTAYSKRMFDLIRDSAAIDKEKLATYAQQEAERKLHAIRQYEKYMQQTEAAEDQEGLLLLPFTSTHDGTAIGVQQQQKRAQLPSPQQQQEAQNQLHSQDDDSSSEDTGGKDDFVFDLSILPIGGYEPRPYMRRYQMTPEEAVEAHLRLRSRVSVASHFDVFPVGSEEFGEAAQRMLEYCMKHNVSTTYEGGAPEAKPHCSRGNSSASGGSQDVYDESHRPSVRNEKAATGSPKQNKCSEDQAGATGSSSSGSSNSSCRGGSSSSSEGLNTSRSTSSTKRANSGMSVRSSSLCSNGSSNPVSSSGRSSLNSSSLSSSSSCMTLDSGTCLSKSTGLTTPAAREQRSRTTAAGGLERREKLLQGGAAARTCSADKSAACAENEEQQHTSGAAGEVRLHPNEVTQPAGREERRKNGTMLALQPGGDMAPKEKKSKEQIAAAAAAGGRKNKKKWSKGKTMDKLNHMVLFDEATYKKLLQEIPKARLITPSIICERLKVNASLARQAIRFLCDSGSIKPVGEHHHAQYIYTRNPVAASSAAEREGGEQQPAQ